MDVNADRHCVLEGERLERRLPILRRLLRNKRGVFGLAVTSGMVMMALFAPVVAPYDPLEITTTEILSPPSRYHMFGTDELARDVLSRVIVASRISVLGSLVAVALATVAGVPWGLIAGFFGGRIDALLMRLVDFLLAVPAVLVAMVIMAILGPSSRNAIIAVSVTTLPTFVRLVRSGTLAEKEKDYVMASRSVGATNGHLVYKTILPNCMVSVLVQMVVATSYAVLLEAALSFLGLGTQPPDPSWGFMLSLGRYHLHESMWYGIFPGAVLTLYVLGLSFLADGLQTGLSPSER